LLLASGVLCSPLAFFSAVERIESIGCPVYRLERFLGEGIGADISGSVLVTNQLGRVASGWADVG
jgi:hypothetical protein